MSYKYSKMERKFMEEQWEFDKKAIKLIATTGIFFAITYNITQNISEYKNNQDANKPVNNIEAILITEDYLKRISNPGIKIKDTDRSDSKKILTKKYNQFTQQAKHYDRKIQSRIKVNDYASNNTSTKYFPNDRRKIERYTLINY